MSLNLGPAVGSDTEWLAVLSARDVTMVSEAA